MNITNVIGLLLVLIGTVFLSISFIPIEMKSIGFGDKEGEDYSAIALKYKSNFLRWSGWGCIFIGTTLQIIVSLS